MKFKIRLKVTAITKGKNGKLENFGLFAKKKKGQYVKTNSDKKKKNAKKTEKKSKVKNDPRTAVNFAKRKFPRRVGKVAQDGVESSRVGDGIR